MSTSNNVSEGGSGKTHFGFSEVAESEKQDMVKGVFRRVASKYDIMNDAMSFGIHRAWKDYFVDIMHPNERMKLLDVAGGTGDISFRFVRAGGGHATLCDINESMLREGLSRSIDEGLYLKGKLDWVAGNAESLPCVDDSFDVYSIAFGIRNVTHIDKALEEAYRVLKIGGRLMCLEFSHPTSALMQKAYDCFSFNVIPKMGEALVNDSDSYQYLVESIRKFPKQEEFCTMIEAAGFSNVSYQNLTGGIVAIHSGWKI